MRKYLAAQVAWNNEAQSVLESDRAVFLLHLQSRGAYWLKRNTSNYRIHLRVPDTLGPGQRVYSHHVERLLFSRARRADSDDDIF